MSGGPLEGVRVIDQTTIVVGPICGRTLDDYGADVIKVEAPAGDLLRTMAEEAGTLECRVNFEFQSQQKICLFRYKKNSGAKGFKRINRDCRRFCF